ncbi:MAG: hypothetical protein JG781_1155 [Peptococcaceae bacterium]|nr:hypothetical protein [Peptococcaceae bacterium]
MVAIKDGGQLMELSYGEYIKFIEESVNDKTLRRMADIVKPLGKFKLLANGQWVPLYYPGYTIITPTKGDDLVNIMTYQVLVEIIERLTGCLDLTKALPAPATALHMTVARLISGELFQKNILNGREQELLSGVNSLFRTAETFRPLEFEIKGISLLPQGVIAAMVSPVNEEDYTRLQSFRDYIYAHETLSKLGIERKRGFKGHITLFYIEDELIHSARKALAACLAEINKEYFSQPLPFKIPRAEIRQFTDFLAFYRNDKWPTYSF